MILPIDGPAGRHWTVRASTTITTSTGPTGNGPIRQRRTPVLSAEVMRARRSVDELDGQLTAKTEEKLFEGRSLGREAEGG